MSVGLTNNEFSNSQSQILYKYFLNICTALENPGGKNAFT